jgi:hypothetical protein
MKKAADSPPLFSFSWRGLVEDAQVVDRQLPDLNQVRPNPRL